MNERVSVFAVSNLLISYVKFKKIYSYNNRYKTKNFFNVKIYIILFLGEISFITYIILNKS